MCCVAALRSFGFLIHPKSQTVPVHDLASTTASSEPRADFSSLIALSNCPRCALLFSTTDRAASTSADSTEAAAAIDDWWGHDDHTVTLFAQIVDMQDPHAIGTGCTCHGSRPLRYS